VRDGERKWERDSKRDRKGERELVRVGEREWESEWEKNKERKTERERQRERNKERESLLVVYSTKLGENVSKPAWWFFWCRFNGIILQPSEKTFCSLFSVNFLLSK